MAFFAGVALAFLVADVAGIEVGKTWPDESTELDTVGMLWDVVSVCPYPPSFFQFNMTI